MKSAVLIPVKSFDTAKDRLSEIMSPAERSELARTMASTVVRAASPLPCFVVCDDPAVAEWAVTNRASVIWRPAGSLNQAVTLGRRHLGQRGFTRLIVAHGDLPFATELAWVDRGSGVTIVTDRHGDGSNVMALPITSDFSFSYGPGSASLHQEEATRLGLACHLIENDNLGWDIDTPDDLNRLVGLSAIRIPE